MIKKPMLAESVDLVYDDELSEEENYKLDLKNLKAQIEFPVICSTKLDGIRCLKVDGKALTRKFLPIPNTHIRTQIEKYLPDGIDGEIMMKEADGTWSHFNDISSAVMSEDGQPEFFFCAFDLVTDDLTKGYKERLEDLENYSKSSKIPFLIVLEDHDINNEEELLEFEKQCIENEDEGVMIRSLKGPYKCGRSTLREGFLLKLKRFKHFEARITGFIEGKTNTNKAKKDALGHTKRSMAKAGMKPAGTLGKFIAESLEAVINIKVGGEVKVGSGTGLTKVLRKEIWDNREDYVGKIIRCKYQSSGAKDKPRFITFDGFRDERDMS